MFDSQDFVVAEIVDARKEKIETEKAWELFQSATEIVVAKGKKMLSFPVNQSSREDILGATLGRSGTLRAPTIKTGNTYIVGFNDDIYTSLL